MIPIVSLAVAESNPSVLKSVPLRSLLVAEVISHTGSQMTRLALPWFVLVTTGSPARMSFVVAAGLAGLVLFGIPSGSVVTRLGGRRTMLVGDALRAPVILSIPLLQSADLLSLPLLLLIAFIQGALSAPYLAAQRVLLPQLLGESESAIGRANAVFQGSTRITAFAGPPLAGLLIAVIGATNVLVIDALTFAVAFGLVALFVPRLSSSVVDLDGQDTQGVWQGVRHIAVDPVLRIWTLSLVVVDGLFQVIWLALPILVVAHYERDPRLAGLLVGAWGAGAVGGNALSYKYFSNVRWSIVAPVLFAQGLPFGLLALPLPAPILIGALALSGLLNGLSNPTFHTLWTLRPPPAVRPKVLSAMFTASSVGGPLAVLVAGSVFSTFGVRLVLAVAVVGVSVATAFEALAPTLTGQSLQTNTSRE